MVEHEGRAKENSEKSDQLSPGMADSEKPQDHLQHDVQEDDVSAYSGMPGLKGRTKEGDTS